MSVRAYLFVVKFKDYKFGTINNIESFSIPDGAASDSLNWLTMGDKIELRAGYKVIGTENPGVGKITGLTVSERIDGTTQAFCTYNRKVKYYDEILKSWTEIGTDVLSANANGEDVTFTQYTSLAGFQTWLSSPNSSLYKIMTANPGSITDVYDSSKGKIGSIRLLNGRLLLWNRLTDKANLYGSKIDPQDTTVYTTVTAESVGTGDGSTKTFSGTLAFKAGSALRTCFAVTVQDGATPVETFVDNRNGVLTGSLGGTGTINYTTGAYSVTFNTAPLNAVALLSSYQWENSSVNGIADFTFSSPRKAAEGYYILQGVGGKLQTVEVIKDVIYCLHDNNAWSFQLDSTDLNPVNKVFRNHIGYISARGAFSTGDGIFYIDTSTPSSPNFCLLSYSDANPEIEPKILTYNVTLNGYDLSDLAVYEFGNSIYYAMKSSSTAPANDTVFVYNKHWKSLDRLDYNVRNFATKDGNLWAGDSLSTNVLQLFTGFDDNDTLIENYWIGNITELGMEQLKKTRRLSIEGGISPDQNIEVAVSYDHGAFEVIGNILGSGDYVDTSNPTVIGSSFIGESAVGGNTNGINIYHYIKEFRIRTEKFKTVQIRFRAMATGYASVSTQTWYDVRKYTQKNSLKYRTAS